MKLSIAALAAAFTGAAADFWLLYLHRDSSTGWVVVSHSGGAFTNDPDLKCDRDAKGHSIYEDAGDVSGSQPGMRTVPGIFVGAPLYRDPLDVVEFNTLDNAPGHHTIYKDRDYAMVNVDGYKSGQCYLNRSYTYSLDCDVAETHVRLSGSSMFFCESDIDVANFDFFINEDI
ncbi:hypothetical protein M426DRAFT_257336 [Hypoxylon sp. CI-4A]|nr:hypothetical protein M426DRAFT_257336 [Hypoxylon sp. CI-4A]